MNWNIVFALAALVAVATFGRDLLRGALEARRKVVKAENDEMMAPLRVHDIVLDDASKAIGLQSALLVQGRADLEAEKKRRIEAESERDAYKIRLDEADKRERDLLVQLGRAWASAPQAGTMPPTKGE